MSRADCQRGFQSLGESLEKTTARREGFRVFGSLLEVRRGFLSYHQQPHNFIRFT
jgi:hypothetical protein